MRMDRGHQYRWLCALASAGRWLLYPTRSARHASSGCWPSMMIVAARTCVTWPIQSISGARAARALDAHVRVCGKHSCSVRDNVLCAEYLADLAIRSLSCRGVSTRSKHGSVRLFGQRPSLPSQTQSRLLRLSPALRRDHRVANPEGLDSIYEVSCLPPRPLQRKALLLSITPQRRGRSGSPCLMIPGTVRAILVAIAVYALRRKCLLWRSLAI